MVTTGQQLQPASYNYTLRISQMLTDDVGQYFANFCLVDAIEQCIVCFHTT